MSDDPRISLGSRVEDVEGHPIGSVLLVTHGVFGNLTADVAREVGAGLIGAAMQADVDAQWINALRALACSEDLIHQAAASVIEQRETA